MIKLSLIPKLISSEVAYYNGDKKYRYLKVYFSFSNMESDIERFFRDKNIFITGGTGFLGKVLIEKLLRSTQAATLYILIRPKNGKNINERINDIFLKAYAEDMHDEKLSVLKRVMLIAGDCSLSNLGLTSEDYSTLIENVDVIVHCAATVRFNEALSNALTINVRATIDLINLGKQMPKLKSFVHVSSAFANCIVPHIAECYYVDKIGLTAEDICKVETLLGLEFINSISDDLRKDFPNTYTFTKALAEDAILKCGSGMPICIFRPAIVLAAYQEPIPGWIDTINGPTGTLAGIAYGILRVAYARKEADAAIVPVDYCVNALLACAWNTAISKSHISNMPPRIYNFVPDSRNLLKWEACADAIQLHGAKMPLSKMIWYPIFIHTDSKLKLKCLSFFLHTLPGYIFDLFLLIRGKKRRMVLTYSKIHKQSEMFHYFKEHNWTFSMDNTKQLWNSLSAEDQNLFNFNIMSMNWSHYIYISLVGMRRFLAKEDPSTIPKALKLLHWLRFLHHFVKVLIIGGSMFSLFWLLSRLF